MSSPDNNGELISSGIVDLIRPVFDDEGKRTGSETITMGRDELVNRLQELREQALTICYGEPISEAQESEILELAKRLLDSQPKKYPPYQDPDSIISATVQKASLLIPPADINQNHLYTVDLSRKHPKNDKPSSEIRVRKHTPTKNGGFQDERAIWLETSWSNLPRVNISHFGLREGQPSAEEVYLALVDRELGAEEGAMLKQQPGKHGIHEKSMDMLTYGTDSDQTPMRRFPSLISYNDCLPHIGWSRCLRQQDTFYVNMILTALRNGVVDVDHKKLMESKKEIMSRHQRDN